MIRFEELPGSVGTVVTGAPFVVTGEDQERFERATWVDRAYPDGDAEEFPSEIVEGFFLLSLLDALARFAGVLDGEGTWGLNYGLDRVRFVSPVMLGDRVVPTFAIGAVRPKGDGFLVLQEATLTVEGAERPAVVAAWWVFVLPRGTQADV